eukprot:854909-Rhodomonas_salina.3
MYGKQRSQCIPKLLEIDPTGSGSQTVDSQIPAAFGNVSSTPGSSGTIHRSSRFTTALGTVSSPAVCHATTRVLSLQIQFGIPSLGESDVFVNFPVLVKRLSLFQMLATTKFYIAKVHENLGKPGKALTVLGIKILGELDLLHGNEESLVKKSRKKTILYGSALQCRWHQQAVVKYEHIYFRDSKNTYEVYKYYPTARVEIYPGTPVPGFP